MKRILPVILFGLFLSLQALAQSSDPPGWNFPEDPQKKKLAKEKNVLYTDELRNERYQAAIKPLHWLLVNTPDLNPSIYINGSRIYETLAEQANDEARQKQYADSAILLYDLRVKHFDEKAEVLNRKAFAAYKLWKDYQDKYPELYNIMKEAHQETGDQFWLQNTVAYMDAARRHKLTGGDLSDKDIVILYSEMDEVLEAQREAGEDSKKVDIMSEQLDKIMAATIDPSCDNIQNHLGELFREDPENTKLAKVILKLSFASKCTDSPIFDQAVDLVQKSEPSVGLSRLIAAKAIQNGDYDRAIQAYESAMEMTEDNIKKAEMMLDIGKIYQQRGMKSSARDKAQQALQIDPSLTEAYRLMGNLYFNSFNDCKQGVSQVDDRAVFLLAYDMYQKAGDRTMMAKAQEQFPTATMIFDANRSEGEVINVGCWINRSVTLRKAPK